MTTAEIILMFMFLMIILELMRAARAWYEAETKSYELAIIRERNKKRQ